MIWAFAGSVLILLIIAAVIVVHAERGKSEALQSQLATLNGALEIARRREEVLMQTALEARGVAVVDPAGNATRQLIAAEKHEKRKRVAQALAQLEAKAAQRARDRDEAVRDQIEEANRLVALARQAEEAK